MRVGSDGSAQFARLSKSRYYAAVVAANRAYLAVAVPDAAATERDYWTLSCLPSTTRNPQRLSAVCMRTMETFVLHEPLDPTDEGVAEGFVVIRRSILKRHWATGRALSRAFPGLTEEPSDYRDAGPDQARVRGRYDQLVAALADDRFAEAVRDLTSSLLTAGTMQGAGHSVALVDEVLGHDARTAEWVYPVNDQSESWGYDQGVLETFRAFTPGEPFANWELGSCFHQIKAGDRIWIYATRPYQRIVAVGTAWDDPYVWAEADGGSEWQLEIRWDLPLTRFLLTHPVAGADVLDKLVQTVRALQPSESERLAKILDGGRAPEPEGLPEGRRRRLAQVTARQGQAEFRRRLLEAYDGKCAISGCDVPEVLQAAHIDPYDGPSTNRITNGLLLRADLHNLFDAGRLWIDDSYRVRMAEGLDHYDEWNGRRLRPTVDPAHRPDRRALQRHRQDQGIE
ncbi:HNH endonuclease [Micromonospora kangleipakensis]|uniref:HNH endonuclease n=1 Tax=Micromonospora kangleipakensis TaxID=1077942 RepID=A0A4Q8B9I0_9ACTN|nr:HNH endonuclease [Micromonospora kangleipakensis]RZU73663.1 HNH endonuclease [Micromonospora kangleipakensis]